METFKINRAYCEWAERAKLPENMEKKYNAAAAIANDYLQEDSTSWEVVTVLYSFNHGITGEKFHFVRVDGTSRNFYKNGTSETFATCEHKTITDAELQEMKKCIV